MIWKFVDDENGVQQLDMIGFIMDSSVPDMTSLQLYINSSLIYMRSSLTISLSSELSHEICFYCATAL